MKKLLIKVSIIAAIIVAFLFIINKNKHLRIDNQRISSNLANYQIRYETESGKWATESGAYQAELSDLRKVNRQIYTELSDYEKKLLNASNIIKDLDKKLKYVQSVNSLLMEAKGSDTVYYTISKIDTAYVVNISDFDDGYLKAVFSPFNDTKLKMEYTYNDNIDVVISRVKDPKDKRFFLWRWLKPKYQTYSTAKTDNPNSEIKVNDYIILK